ncbi:hypothetical protein [Scytonema sp. NUACC26]|uniref:hypothetical protein n=1 Tax=Scytonema sp. NUACC26 TaxID=3140176 RepID=UPI0034DC8EFC
MKILYLSTVFVIVATIVALRHYQSQMSSMCLSTDNTSLNSGSPETSAYNFLVESDRTFN